MSCKPARLRVFLVALPLLLAPLCSLATEEIDPEHWLREAKARGGTIPGQARELILLAWGDSHPRVAAAARAELVDYGQHGLSELRMALRTIDPRFSADVVSVMLEGRRAERSGLPQDFLPGLEEAIWYGGIGARRLAMVELSRYPYPPLVLTTIDAIEDHPELTLLGIRALGAAGNERARFFLSRVLSNGQRRYQIEAAMALGGLGETGLQTLRNLSRATDLSIRDAALYGLLPHSQIEDLTALHEYVGSGGSGDELLLERVRNRAVELEVELEETNFAEPPGGS